MTGSDVTPVQSTQGSRISSRIPTPPRDVMEIMDASWKIVKTQMGLVAGLSLVLTMGALGLNLVPYVGWLISGILPFGYVACLIKVRNGESFDFEDFFWPVKSMSRLINCILCNVLTTLMMVVGFIFLIIPFIYVSVPLTLTGAILVTKDIDAIDAIKRSFNLTKGNWWYVAWLGGALVILNIIGLLCFVVGILITIPMSTVMILLCIESLSTSSEAQDPAPISFKPLEGSGSTIPVNPS